MCFIIIIIIIIYPPSCAYYYYYYYYYVITIITLFELLTGLSLQRLGINTRRGGVGRVFERILSGPLPPYYNFS